MKRAGDELGGYVVARRLGSGGMGTVYEAVDADGRHVALKLLHPHIGADPVARDRLRREVETLHRVRHTGVARVLDAEADSEEAFVVTELIEGPTLDDHVREQGPLAGEDLADLARGLLAALAAIHEADVVHRDVKPANVMLTADGPVLIDFGISQILDADRYTQVGLVTGTPGYLDPLVAAGAHPEPEGDWWSWAAVLVFSATARQPFGGGPIPAVLGRVAIGQVDVAGLPPDIARALRAALEPSGARLSPPDLLAVLEGDPAGLAALDAVEGAPAQAAEPRAGAAATEVVPAPWLEPQPGAAPTTVVPAPLLEPGTTPIAAPAPVAPTPTRVQPISPPPPPPPPRPPVAPGAPWPVQTAVYRPPADPGGPRPPAAPVGGVAAQYGTAAAYGASVRYPPSAQGAPPGPGGPSAYGPPGYGQPGSGPPPSVQPIYGPAGHGQPQGGLPYGVPPGGLYGQPGAVALPYDAPPPGRHLFMFMLWLLITSLAALWPGAVLAGVLLALLVCGAVASSARVRRARRRRRGPRSSDAAVSWLLSPWYVVHAVLIGILAVLAGALAGATTWFLSWTILTGEPIGQAVGGGSIEAAVTAGSVAMAVAAAWLAPTSRLLREGGREVLAVVLPGPRQRAVTMLLAAALAVLFALVVVAGVTAPVWAPVPSPIP